jgi:biotin--protein ligase
VVKIVGITPEHGMLRTVPVELDRQGREIFSGGMGLQQYIDLQPDGNSFDMIQGLLKSKST